MSGATNIFDVGDQIRLEATFTVDGTDANPTTVVGKVKDPNGAITLPTVSASSTGVYYMDLYVGTDGDWYYRFEGTGSVVAACEGVFRVRKSAFL